MAIPLPIPRDQIKSFIMTNWRQKPSVVMAQEIGVSRTTICAIAKELGVKPGMSVKVNRPVKEVMQERINWIRLNGENMTIPVIAKKLGVSYFCIHKMVGRYRLKVKVNRDAIQEPVAYMGVPGRKGMFNVHQRENWLV